MENGTNLTAEVDRFTGKATFSVGSYFKKQSDLKIAICAFCKKYSLWQKNEMIYPDSSLIAEPSNYLSEKIKGYYNQARSIAKKSPQSSCMLLRLSLETLLEDEFGLKGMLFNQIEGLKKKVSLSETLDKRLELIRKSGNDAGHTREIHLSDDYEVAELLFAIINDIVRELIEDKKKFENFSKKFNNPASPTTPAKTPEPNLNPPTN